MAEAAVSLRSELETVYDASDVDETAAPVADAAPDAAGQPAPAGAKADDAAGSAGTADTATDKGTDRSRDAATGKFTKADAAAEGKPAAATAAEATQAGAELPAAQDAQQAPANLEVPPSTWTPQAKAEYLAASPVLKAEIKKREADFQKGIAQYRDLAQHGNAYVEAVRPYLPMIQAEGGDPLRAVASLLNTAYRLRTGSPQERGQLVMALAQQYGADLAPWLAAQQQAAQDGAGTVGMTPAQIQAQIQTTAAQVAQDQFRRMQQAAQQQHDASTTQATRAQLEQFAAAVNEKGQPKHVYFDNVRAIMASLIEGGVVNTLDEAYAHACRAHPEVAKAMDAERRRADDSQRLSDARKKVDDAKRAAGANVSGQGGVGVADSGKLTLRDELSAQLEGRATV